MGQLSAIVKRTTSVCLGGNCHCRAAIFCKYYLFSVARLGEGKTLSGEYNNAFAQWNIC